MRRYQRTFVFTIFSILLSAAAMFGQTSAFTYQGKLSEAGTAATGQYDFTFRLFTSAIGGTQVGTDVVVNDVQVTAGIFTVTLDFGSPPFTSTTGNALEISVRPGASTGTYTALVPRQPLTSSPYAVQTLRAALADNATQLGGVAAGQYVLTGDPRLTDARPASSVDFSIATVTGTLPIAKGGTGSATQNFVDLLTDQTIGGTKTFSSIIDGSAAKPAMNTGNSATPSVANLTLLALNYTVTTTLTNLTGGVDGQCVVLLSLNNNVAIVDAGNFRLSTSWNPLGDGTLTVCRSDASGVPLWYERARSANFSPTFLLTVTKAGAGTGTVTSNPAGINCGADCTENYFDGELVTLGALASGSSTFAGWSGGGCTGTGSCQVTIDAAKTVTATFVPNFFLVVNQTTANGGTGTVTSNPAGINCGADCSESYSSGTLVTLTATASGSSTFVGWSGSGCTGTGTCQVTMDASKAVTARFDLLFFSLTVTNSGSGTVTSNPAGINCPSGATCSASFVSDTAVALTASPGSGAIFMSWTNCPSASGTTCNVTMNSNKTVGANFSPPPATVTNVTSSTANGTYSTGAPISIQVTFNQIVSVEGAPRLALNSGGTGNFASGSGTNTLSFNYTVAAGQNSVDLDYTSTSALTLNFGSIKNFGSTANLALPPPGAAGSLGFNKNIVIAP